MVKSIASFNQETANVSCQKNCFLWAEIPTTAHCEDVLL